MPIAYAEGYGDYGAHDVAGSGAATLYADPISRLIREQIINNTNVARYCGARVWVYTADENAVTPNVVVYRVTDPKMVMVRGGGIRYQVSVRAPKGNSSVLEVIGTSIINALDGFRVKRGAVEINTVRYLDRQTYTEQTTKNERSDIDFQVFYVLRM